MTTTGRGICDGCKGMFCFDPAEWLVEHELLRRPLRLCKRHCDEVAYNLRKNKGMPKLTRIEEKTDG